jgi:hypothetical protein
MEEKTQAPGSRAGQVRRSILGGLLGSTAGVLAWFIFDENNPKFIPFLIGALGIAAGVGLSLRGVSAKRVAKGVVAGIVAKPLPGPLRGMVFDAITREKEELPPQPHSPDPPPPDGLARLNGE